MRFRFTIANKIGIGFGILVLFVAVNLWISNSILRKNEEIRHKIITEYHPSKQAVVDLTVLLTESKVFIHNWVFTRKDSTNYKKHLIEIHESKYPELQKRIARLSSFWSKEQKDQWKLLSLGLDSLFSRHQAIMGELSNSSSYYNFDFVDEKKEELGKYGPIMSMTDRNLNKLKSLNQHFSKLIDSHNLMMQKKFDQFRLLIVWAGVVLFIAVIIIAFVVTGAMVRPINQLKKVLVKMSLGEVPEKAVPERLDEVGEMGKALNGLINGLKNLSQFSKEIGKGNYASKFEPLGPNDELGNSLLLMRDNLKNASEEAEMRRIENNQRSWSSQGLAEFGEMLRESKESLEELTNQILTKLVRYLDARVGGLFIINDDNKEDTYLELIAFYAYDRRKYIEKRVEIGESLIGQCVLENQTIFMSEIPKDYVHISSGMGKDDPRSLIIVPLKLNEEVYGVVELASFKIFEPYQIEFVEKIGESIASTISSAKINIHTSKLLQESNEKSERLTKQEEESQKQIEEMERSIQELKSKEEKEKEHNKTLIAQYKSDLSNLRKTNEKNHQEIEKIKMDLKNVSQAVDNALGTYALSINGEFVEANDRYLKMTGISFNELKGKKLDDLMTEEGAKSLDIQNFIPNLLSGHIYRKLNKYVINNEARWFSETFTPLYDEDGKFTKILCLVKDETESMQKRQEQRELIEKLQSDLRRLKQRMV